MMYQDPDFPLEMAENYYGELADETMHSQYEEQTYEASYGNLQHVGMPGSGNRLQTIIGGSGSYAQRLNKLNNLNKEERAYGRAILASSYFYNINQPDYILNTIEKFVHVEYRNMVALVGSILFYNNYKLSNKENSIHQADLLSFFAKYPKLNGEIAIEDLLRYIRLAISTLSK